MKAIVHHRYGSPDILEFQDVDPPTVPDNGVLVRVHAASVNPYDWHVMRGLPYVVRIDSGLRAPKRAISGIDLAGRVEAVGRNVQSIKPGDEVYGQSAGTFAEYVCGRETGLAPKPANLTFEQAAAVPCAGFTAMQGLRDKGQVQPGHKILINGAAGGVGTFAVQIAKSLGADVTGVCSTRNIDLVRSIGADHVIDYTQEDFTRSGQRYDVVFDLVANHSLSRLRRVLEPSGTLVLCGAPRGQWIGPLVHPLRALVLSRFVRQSMVPFLAQRSRDDLAELTELIEAGEVTPVIDRSFPLSEAAEAVRYLETGHAQGKVVITV